MTDLIPREVLFGNPERISPAISPDGTRLGWIAPHEGVLNVWVAPIGASGVDWDAAVVVTDDADRGHPGVLLGQGRQASAVPAGHRRG